MNIFKNEQKEMLRYLDSTLVKKNWFRDYKDINNTPILFMRLKSLNLK